MRKQLRQEVHQKYNGHCAYCGKEIEYKDMQVDHIQSKRAGGENDIRNYNPSCGRCNHYKRSLNLDDFRDYIKTLHERISKDYITKVGIDYGIVRLEPFDGKFYFEREAPDEKNTKKV